MLALVRVFGEGLVVVRDKPIDPALFAKDLNRFALKCNRVRAHLLDFRCNEVRSALLMRNQAHIVLGLETSCDETAAAVLRRDSDGSCEVLAETVASQIKEHTPFGGVVPEIAARAHVEKVDRLVRDVMSDANLEFQDIDCVAATAGPGLIGGVMVGLMSGKAIALAQNKPFVAVNHLEGHALSPRLMGDVPFPYLLLLVSGGHCQFLLVEGLGDYRRLGSTIDDAVGEAFDKTAKLLGLGFPGGPALERAAIAGDPNAVKLPRPLLNNQLTLDMSFAGLKTAVLRAASEMPLTEQRIADLCASFQVAVADILTGRASQAMTLVANEFPGAPGRFVAAGGVAANKLLRSRLQTMAEKHEFSFSCPPMKWCTDNGAMIALAGAERFAAGLVDDLMAPARARWPLDSDAASNKPVYGSGKKGAKA